MLILSSFYAVNEWREYRAWKWSSLLVVVSLVATIWGGIGFVQEREHSHSQSTVAQTQSSSSMSAQQQSLPQSTLQKLPGDNQADQNKKELYLLRQLQKGYAKFGSVGFDEKSKTYIINATDKQTKEALNQMANDPSQAGNSDSFKKLCHNFQDTSKAVKQNLGSGYHVKLVADNGRVLYEAVDGRTVTQLGQQ